MKKKLCMMLAMVMIVGLVACGETSQTTEPEKETTNISEEISENNSNISGEVSDSVSEELSAYQGEWVYEANYISNTLVVEGDTLEFNRNGEVSFQIEYKLEPNTDGTVKALSTNVQYDDRTIYIDDSKSLIWGYGAEGAVIYVRPSVAETTFIENLKNDHSDWYEDYMHLIEVISCFGMNINDVAQSFDLKQYAYDGEGYYRLENGYGWFGLDGYYRFWTINDKVETVEFIYNQRQKDTMLENIEEMFGITYIYSEFEGEEDYNWYTDIHVASFCAYFYVEDKQAQNGILFIKNSEYEL